MTIKLKDIDPSSTPDAPGNKAATAKATEKLSETSRHLQERLYAEGSRSLLVVLQAMDTGGKDGAIKQIFRSVNPAGVRIASFKAPNAIEAAHDFLWRVHAEAPGRGEVKVFNRSHYEDVLVARVREFVPETTWRARYEQINDFEQLLAASGTTIVKFFLHISKDEQRERLLARLDDPTKRWKFNEGDLAERERWDAYMAAYEDAVNNTSTETAPWHVVPADKKWYRDFVVTRVLVDTLTAMDPQFPRRDDLDAVDRDFA
jgi:PPK2 family polyphosphate:nucleotide phosphotransferase